MTRGGVLKLRPRSPDDTPNPEALKLCPCAGETVVIATIPAMPSNALRMWLLLSDPFRMRSVYAFMTPMLLRKIYPCCSSAVHRVWKRGNHGRSAHDCVHSGRSRRRAVLRPLPSAEARFCGKEAGRRLRAAKWQHQGQCDRDLRGETRWLSP